MKTPRRPDRYMECFPSSPKRRKAFAPRTTISPLMDPIVAIIVILVVAKVFGEGLERLGYPPMIGEIGAGVLLGPAVLGLVTLDETLEVFATIGVIALLFISGVEMNPKAFAAAKSAAAFTAGTGVAVPFALGFLGGALLGLSFAEQFFLAVILSITSIGVSVRALIDLRRLDSLVGNTVIGAAVVDDIIGIVLLGVLSPVALSGRLDLLPLAGALLLAVLFIGFAFTIGRRLSVWLFRISRSMLTHEMPYVAAIAIALATAAAAHALGLHYAIGAFVAGIILGRQVRNDRSVFDGIIDFGFGFFVTFFFASIGLLFSPDPAVFVGLLVPALIVLAIAGKTLGGYLGSRYFLASPAAALTVGFGISARGEIALVVAQVSLAAGIIGAGLYSAVTVMVIATIFAAPLLMKWGFALQERGARGGRPSAETQ
ncbi:cation:proton antiporter [Methanoculleus sp. FWC-SCC1]|uniref:Cation:proton antiporter n=2 Tax=Methanoculleus frigidifontis TaxID=2584085 RepID=A0ABT8MCP3_9EURY|nr:cation:proton antiporter [Methanoculleus sp. FWC-SCC1]